MGRLFEDSANYLLFFEGPQMSVESLFSNVASSFTATLRQPPMRCLSILLLLKNGTNSSYAMFTLTRICRMILSLNFIQVFHNLYWTISIVHHPNLSGNLKPLENDTVNSSFHKFTWVTTLAYFTLLYIQLTNFRLNTSHSLQLYAREMWATDG